MHVAFVSFETVFHRETETNRRVHTAVESLRDGGHDVHVFCARFWEDVGLADQESIYERNGVIYHAVADDIESRASFFFRLPVALAATRPDIIHTSVEPLGQVLAANWGSRIARVPIVLEWYDTVDPTRRRLFRWATRQSSHIITPSELVDTRVRKLGINDTRITRIPNPIDTDLVREVSPGERVEVVYARRLDDGANLESLLLALAEMREKRWNAVVIGDGPHRDYYEKLASDLRIDDRITFAGELSRERRIAIYRGAHVFVQTANRCVFPTEMLWALSAGCVGIVEYHAESSAHELVEGWPRGFRTTSGQELTDAIVDAGELEYRSYDDRFEGYDSAEIRDRYLESYRTARAEFGFL